MTKHILKLALSLVFFLTSSPALASEATDLAAVTIAAYGGPEAIERNRSFKQSGALTSNRYSETGTVERTFSRPDKLRIDIQIPGAPHETRVLNGQRGWRNGKEDQPMMARAMFLQAARLDLPYLILKSGPDIKMDLTVTSEKDGRGLKGLEIPMAERLRLIAIIDTKTGYIVRSRGLISVAPGHELEFTTVYSDHRQVNGMVFAAREDHFVRGQATGITVLDKSEVVQELPGAVFLP